MSKTYSSKSNALRAAAKLAAHSGVKALADGRWVVLEEEAGDEVPPVELEAPTEAAPVLPAVITDTQAAIDVQRAADAEVFDAAHVDSFSVSITVTAKEAVSVAQFIATRFGRVAEVFNLDTDNLVQRVEPVAKGAPAARAVASGPRRADRDWTVKPVITAGSQLHMQAMFDKIEAKRGDLAALLALDTFKRSATYTKMAGRYLDALVAEARARDLAQAA